MDFSPVRDHKNWPRVCHCHQAAETPLKPTGAVSKPQSIPSLPDACLCKSCRGYCRGKGRASTYLAFIPEVFYCTVASKMMRVCAALGANFTCL